MRGKRLTHTDFSKGRTDTPDPDPAIVQLLFQLFGFLTGQIGNVFLSYAPKFNSGNPVLLKSPDLLRYFRTGFIGKCRKSKFTHIVLLYLR